MEDFDDVEVNSLPLRRKVKPKKVFDDAMEDDELLYTFKHDHGLEEKYDE